MYRIYVILILSIRFTSWWVRLSQQTCGKNLNRALNISKTYARRGAWGLFMHRYINILLYYHMNIAYLPTYIIYAYIYNTIYRTCSVYALLFYDKYLSHAYLYTYIDTCFSPRTSSIYCLPVVCRKFRYILLYYTVTITYYTQKSTYIILYQT